jgi:hypothetical protein
MVKEMISFTDEKGRYRKRHPNGLSRYSDRLRDLDFSQDSLQVVSQRSGLDMGIRNKDHSVVRRIESAIYCEI